MRLRTRPMSHSQKQRSAAASANAVGGKTARACYSCLRCRARWYCAADDAFLCQGCDSSVHSANPLARRHQRLRLKNSSSSSPAVLKEKDVVPTWHRGFKRKARTRRPQHHSKPAPRSVPEVDTSVEEEHNEEEEEEEEEQQLLYRVPIFDPVLSEFYSPPLLDEETKPAAPSTTTTTTTTTVTNDGLAGFLPSDMELAEFAADMESLLGRGLDNDSFSLEELGLLDSKEDGANSCLGESGRVKVELELDEDTAAPAGSIDLYEEIDLSRETLELNFDSGSPTAGEEAEEEDKSGSGREEIIAAADACHPAKRIGLRLNHEAIMEAWSVHGSSFSPWTNGERPQFGPDDCWIDYMVCRIPGMWGGGEVQVVLQGEVGGGQMDGGREARVTRYREKRRTRLFSKKIRYEVRKLNAEKRPRMKGRFVKRASFIAATAFPIDQY